MDGQVRQIAITLILAALCCTSTVAQESPMPSSDAAEISPVQTDAVTDAIDEPKPIQFDGENDRAYEGRVRDWRDRRRRGRDRSNTDNGDRNDTDSATEPERRRRLGGGGLLDGLADGREQRIKSRQVFWYGIGAGVFVAIIIVALGVKKRISGN